MTAIPIPAATRPEQRRGTDPSPAVGATPLHRWIATRRRRRHLIEERRHDRRDRSDRYLDGMGDEHLLRTLTAFAGR